MCECVGWGKKGCSWRWGREGGSRLQMVVVVRRKGGEAEKAMMCVVDGCEMCVVVVV